MFFNLRRCFVPHERGLARTWQERAEQIRNEPLRDEYERFDKLLRCDLDEDRIILARAERNGESFWAGLPVEEMLGNHAWITGGTGSGKTFELLSLILQVLTRPNIPIVVVDLKGEFATLLLDLVLPALTAHGQNPHLLANLRVIRPFDDTYLPMLRITQAEEGVPHEIQSWNLAASLAEALAEDLGARMNRVFLRMTTLAIELNEPLTALKEWLEDPVLFAQAARRSRDGSLRTYALKVFERENQNSIQSLLARLDTFLLLPSTRLALSAPSCASFSAALESGLTIVDLGDPPAGAERVARFWAGILIGRLTRAILSRPVKDDSPRCWVIFEEFQEALAKDQAQQFGRLLALARFKKLSLWFCNQQPAQLAAIDPTLVKLLQTNADLLAAFRCNIDDARTFAHALPLSDARQDSEPRHALINEMTRLERRQFYMWLKNAPFRAQKVRSPRLDLEPLKERAAAAPAELKESIRKGTVAVRKDSLKEQVVSEQATDSDRHHDPEQELYRFLVPSDDETDTEMRLG